MNEQNKKVPTVRFKGFTNDWEQHKLGEVCEKTYSGLTGKNKQDFGHGKAKYITYLNVHDNAIATTKGVDQVEIDPKQNEVVKGDLLFTVSSEVPEEVALNSVWPGTDNNVYLNSFCFGMRPMSKSVNSFFLTYYLRSPQMRRNIYPLAQGISRFNISKRGILSLTINLPNIREQINVYKVIKNIECLVTLQQQKLDLLKQLKKGLLQKMFADKDSKRPVLRFKGFHDDWEQRRLGEVAEIKTGSRNHQDSVDNGKYPFFIRSEKVERLNEYDFDTKAILVPGDGRIGEIFHYYDGKFALHQRVYKVDNFKEVNPLYLLNLFKYKFKKHALRLNAQGTVPSLRLPMFTNWNILIPNLNEQQKIGLFFQQLDSLITLQQRKQNHLKLLKKSLLQQMFI